MGCTVMLSQRECTRPIAAMDDSRAYLTRIIMVLQMQALAQAAALLVLQAVRPPVRCKPCG